MYIYIDMWGLSRLNIGYRTPWYIIDISPKSQKWDTWGLHGLTKSKSKYCLSLPRKFRKIVGSLIFEHRSPYPGPVQLDFFTAVPSDFAEDRSIVARQRVLSLKALPLGGSTKVQPGAVAQQLEITSGWAEGLPWWKEKLLKNKWQNLKKWLGQSLQTIGLKFEERL